MLSRELVFSSLASPFSADLRLFPRPMLCLTPHLKLRPCVTIIRYKILHLFDTLFFPFPSPFPLYAIKLSPSFFVRSPVVSFYKPGFPSPLHSHERLNTLRSVVLGRSIRPLFLRLETLRFPGPFFPFYVSGFFFFVLNVGLRPPFPPRPRISRWSTFGD